MNTDTFKGKWDQIKGSLKETWGDLTNQDLEKMKGGVQEAVGYLHDKYGESKESIEKKFSTFMDKFKIENNRGDDDEDEEDKSLKYRH